MPAQRRPRGRPTTQVNVRINTAQLEQLRHEADERQVSLAFLIDRAIEMWLDLYAHDARRAS